MWNEVIGNLILYGNYFLLTAMIMIIVAVGSSALIRLIKWKSGTLKFFGIFVEMKRGKLIALSLILIRMIFFWSIILYSTSLEMTHICYGLIVTAIIHILLANLEGIIFDFLYTILIYGELYISNMLSSYLSDIQMKASVIAMQVVINIFIVITTLYCAIECIRTLTKHSIKENRRIRYNTMGQHAALLIAGVFMVVVPYYFINKIDTLTIQQDVYQYTAEKKVTYSGNSKITKSGNGCVLENNGEQQKLAETPLYYTKENKILLTNVISIIQPKLSLTNRISNMSELYEKDNKYFVENEQGTIKVSDFFLYDGRDTYIFFEPITLSWDNQSLDLKPFSYITVKYNQTIEVFNKETETFSTIETGICDMMTTMNCGASINLSTDILYRENGQEQMLFLQPNLLEDLK